MQLPLKNIPGAILFCVFLGPIGLLYTSVLGGIVMCFLTLVALGAYEWRSLVLVWMICCIWTVIAANRTNKKLVSESHAKVVE